MTLEWYSVYNFSCTEETYMYKLFMYKNTLLQENSISMIFLCIRAKQEFLKALLNISRMEGLQEFLSIGETKPRKEIPQILK